MRVVVELYGTLQRLLPDSQRRVELDVEENTTVIEVLVKLGVEVNEAWTASLNGMLADPADIVSEGSLLIAFPPITGG